MATLKEIKTRIASVRSTLKITSAMKMVSSAKLHHARQAIGNMLPYEKKLKSILSNLQGDISPEIETSSRKVAVIAFSSNTSLCGAFNANALKKLSGTVKSLQEEGYEAEIFAIGKKIADGAVKAGLNVVSANEEIADKPSYKALSEMAADMIKRFSDGEYARVELVYNHCESSASQPSVREVYLPIAQSETQSIDNDYFIIEPDRQQLLEELLPKVLKLKLYSVALDADAASHAARVVAMQMASDNAGKLLEELTLEYNKRRQQAITSELLDIVGGSISK